MPVLFFLIKCCRFQQTDGGGQNQTVSLLSGKPEGNELDVSFDYFHLLRCVFNAGICRYAIDEAVEARKDVLLWRYPNQAVVQLHERPDVTGV